MIVISSKVIGIDIVLNDDYCDYRKHTDEVIIDLDRLKDILEDVYTYGKSGCKQLDSIEYGVNSDDTECENIHKEREQAYMQGYEDACKKYRQEPQEM